METLDERSFKEKLKDKYYRAKMKVEDGIRWVKENPKEVAIIATATAATVKTCYKIGKTVGNYVDEKESRKEIYCNDIQSTVKLKHELSYKEARELRDRMDSGETKFSALDEMGLLKK